MIQQSQSISRKKDAPGAFNRAHASHMGGSWERLIGDARRIRNAMLLQKGRICLTSEILSTFNGGGDGNHQCKTHCVHVNRPGDAPCSLSKRLVLSWPPLETFVQFRCMGSRGNKSSVLLTPFGSGGKESISQLCRAAGNGPRSSQM